MKATAKDSGEEGRIVNVSSYGHNLSYKLDELDKISDPKRYNTTAMFARLHVLFCKRIALSVLLPEDLG
jgi:hypothetical protein